MKTLVLDASSNILYISFYDNNKEIYLIKGEGRNNHSENLLQAVSAGLDQCNLRLSDFKKIIVGIGPGSYTGLRVALTVAKMFAWTLEIPLYTASSLDILASGYFNNDGIYAITSRAKKGHVYGKLLEIKSGGQNVIFDDCFLETEKFLKKIEGYNYFEVNSDNYRFNPLNLNIHPVSNLHELTPNYLRSEI
jgi:tRNA threonylcarbamoyladenosine biosynthesis protein TsaB